MGKANPALSKWFNEECPKAVRNDKSNTGALAATPVHGHKFESA